MTNKLIDPVTGDEVVDILAGLDPELLNQKCLDHGFVKVLDCMPRLVPASLARPSGDFALADAARISYQKGTRKINEDAGLVDYLTRNLHTSPIEMAELKFQIRLPIFCMRQHVR
jgi:thymidylate synthase (FAD)